MKRVHANVTYRSTLGVLTNAVTVAALLLSALMLAATPLAAQVSAPVADAIERARGQINSGNGDAARTMLDSLVNGMPRSGDDFAEALYWRAVMSDQVADAERDWKTLVVAVPLSTRVPDALLRLGELEILRGQPAGARVYYERIARDFSGSPQSSRAMLWTARSYFEERDLTRACATVAALRADGPLEGELLLQSTEMQGRCNNAAGRSADLAPITGSNSAPPAASATSGSASGSAPARSTPAPAPAVASTGRYSVQLAAYDTKAQANAALRRFAAAGIKARVDGTRKPFRIRSGNYATHAEATAELARLKKKGHKGFVAVLDK